MTIQAVAHHLGVSWDVVKAIHKRYLQTHFAQPPLADLTYVAIDEVCVGRPRKFLTIVLNLVTGAVAFVGESPVGNLAGTSSADRSASTGLLGRERRKDQHNPALRADHRRRSSDRSNTAWTLVHGDDPLVLASGQLHGRDGDWEGQRIAMYSRPTYSRFLSQASGRVTSW